jgi:cellobiose phosphorylase
LTPPNPYGYFDADAREYVITRPDTPTPWMNYLGEGRYGGIISNTAGGYSFDRDPKNRRVTRYRYNSIPADQPGRYIYLRDQDSGAYWSPTWQPNPARQLEAYECRHGAGYTRIRSEYQGIAAEILYFVPPGASCELWQLKLKNLGGAPRRLRAFSYAEFSYFDAVNDQTNLDWAAHIMHARVEEGVVYACTQFRPETTFFAAGRDPIGFDTDREVFIGRCRDLANPVVVESGLPQGSLAPRGNTIGALCHEIELAPGEETQLVYLLGESEQPAEIQAMLARYRSPGEAAAAFAALQADWAGFLSSFQVETPDPETNAMLNFWNAVQCRTTLYWSRFVSAYETGLGRGMGTRDSAQDTLATVQSVPGHARRTLETLWRLQFRDGHTWHQVFPLTGEGGPGLAAEYPAWPQWFCDDHLWLVIASAAYLRETGDFDYLDHTEPYWDALRTPLGGAAPHAPAGEEGQGEPADPDESVWGHLLRAVQFTCDHLGPHGLPRLGFSDWDDTMNLDHGSGKAESVWCAQQFCRAVLDMAELCTVLGKSDERERFLGLHAEMAERINATSWDGDWYVRAYDDAGLPVGTHTDTFNQISLNPQTWSVLGEAAPRERQEQAMESIHRELNTPYGVRLLTPAYRSYEERIRGTTTYPPGAKENGGIFCHANAWVIAAAAKLGWGDRAYQYYRQVLPLARADADTYLVEPYVYCQNICGPEHPQYGMGRNAWLTGTAAWTYVAGTQYLLGIRATFQGLQIAPALPSEWPGFTAQRVFRGVRYHITVERGPQAGMTVDGKAVEGNVVPLPVSGNQNVSVRLVV